MSALGLRMDDGEVRVAVGLCLGVSLCQPHHCHQCGTKVDHLGLHGLSHHFVPFAIETSGVFGYEAVSLLEDIGRQIRAETGEPQSFQFFLQGVSVAIQ